MGAGRLAAAGAGAGSAGGPGVEQELQTATELQREFGIEGSVEFGSGEGGLPCVVLSHACGAEATVYLYGACVASWIQPGGHEVLYVRPDAVFDRSKPISGGIPLCFPQFGPGAMQQHGFARNLDWRVAATSADFNPDDKDPEVELVLEDNDFTRAMFPHKFLCSYVITLHNDVLRTRYTVVNKDDKPFSFTGALHSYFEVAGIENAQVLGLQELTYLDKVPDPESPAVCEETAPTVRFGGETDRVYLGAPGSVQLDIGTGAAVEIQSSNWPDCVVWNPWTAMEACYREFCCVENAVAREPVTLQPGEEWTGKADFLVVDL